MRALFLRELRRFLTGRLLFLALVCVLFSLSERKHSLMSYDNFVLHMISEHYYLTFFMVPMVFYLLYHHLEEDLEAVLIRAGSYPRYFAVKAAALAANMSMVVLLQFAVIMLAGLGLPAGADFPLSDKDDPMLTKLLVFSETFQYPWQATLVSVLYMMFGLGMLAIVFLTLHHFLEKRKVAILTITLYFLMVYGMKSKIPELTRIPFIFINNYIIFIYNLTYPYALQVSLISLAMVAAAICWLIGKHWSKGRQWQWYRPGKRAR
ncbi:hypothetical protein [Paenibacillus donghaensis]|uniref:Uncharacterized protein n=1 Tax=Paenibacillus donghaensis TaxID=414771 RepID=A0A2Z2KRC0_9BACL|nr:hypothetical protein [Paenibacillus donghaensis]ASA23972.1 hypothetical protein B9T62_26230 [Paenibacillus donghaensis]